MSSLPSSSFSQSRSSEVEGFFLRPGTSRSSKKMLSASDDQPLLDAGEVHVDDCRCIVSASGKLDVVEEAAAQEGVRQFLLVVRRDDDDGADGGLSPFRRSRRRRTPCDPTPAAGRWGIRCRPCRSRRSAAPGRSGASEGLPQLAAADVVGDVLCTRLSPSCAVAQAGHCVILIKALLGLGGGLDVPLDDGGTEAQGDLAGQHRFAGAGFALHQQRTLEHDGRVDSRLEVLGRDVIGWFLRSANPVSRCSFDRS